MLKKRIIATLLFRDGVLVRTKKFVPDYFYTKEHINTSDCDEICCIRVGGSWGDFFDAVNHVCDESMMPVSVGGGIESISDIGTIFRETVADKVVLESHFASLTPAAQQKFGTQSIVAGVTEGRFVSFDDLRHAGEIFVQSIERDGSLRGYPIEWGKRFLEYGIPVIIGSGCEGYRSMLQGFRAGFDACATSNIHHFSRFGMKNIRDRLVREGISLRDGNEVQGLSYDGHPTEDYVQGRGL